jgi:glycosyltransferase involved in cell wall biosynthesis
MRIVIDIQSLQSESRYRGIGRYSSSLAKAMAQNAGNHDVWLVVNGSIPDSIFDIRHSFSGLIPPEKIRVFDVPVPVAEHDSNNAWRSRTAEKIREHFIYRLQPDIIHVASLFENPSEEIVTSVGTFTSGDNTAVTLYDLIPYLNQETYLPNKILKNWYFGKIKSLKRAGLLLAISDYCRQEAIEALAIPKERVVNISAAIDGKFQKLYLSEQEASALKEKYGIQRRMVMYAPGGFDARKNFDGLIQAYSRLPIAIRQNYQLVIASKIGDMHRLGLETLAKEAGLNQDELVMTGYIPDADLVKVYNLATLFVFPSKHEGFGLPALEAMACGIPTIGSATTSIPEVIGLKNALFDPNSVESIAKKIVEVLENDDMRRYLSEHGLERAKNFSWDASAKVAIEAFERLHEKKSHISVYPNSDFKNDGIDSLLQAIGEVTTEVNFSNQDIALASRSIAYNLGTNEPRQFLLDISTIIHQDAGSGIQRVVKSILMELLQNPPSGFLVRPIYFHNHQYYYANAFVKRLQPEISVPDEDSFVDFAQDDIYLSLDLNMHLATDMYSLHLRMKALGVYLFYIIYDILLIHRPDWWAPELGGLFQHWLKSISETATGFVCISRAVADEVQEWLSHNIPARLDVPLVESFHLGADVENSLPTVGMPDGAEKILSILESKPSFLMVGTLEPRKGYGQALEAFELLWQRNIDANLIIVGKQGWLVDSLADRIRAHSELGKRFFWLEGISDEYLKKIYGVCSCLIAASEGEGFGLPLIEAAQHGLPIIARDLPVFHEVAGETAMFFSGLEPASLASVVERWTYMSPDEKTPLPSKMQWLTWSQSAKQLLEGILPHSPAAKTRLPKA